MNRREFQIAIGLGALATALGSLAQQPRKMRHVGWLSYGSHPSSQEFIDEVKRALLDLGYRDGRDIVFDLRFSDGKLERRASLAAELVALQPDLIVTGTHGRKGLTRFVLGSVSHALLHSASYPVLVYR